MMAYIQPQVAFPGGKHMKKIIDYTVHWNRRNNQSKIKIIKPFTELYSSSNSMYIRF
jgi:hypothetical protein